ncbi:MAG: PAS domain S-box protein [Verrucomicrobiaceae bacterium]|nr:PAS domain S-box protein [Verrucomicrobiaceae bacterium]
MKKPVPKTAPKPAREELNIGIEEVGMLVSQAGELDLFAEGVLGTPRQVLYIFSFQTQKFSTGQDQVYSLYGYKPGEVEKSYKDGWDGIIHPEDKPAYRSMNEQLQAGKENGLQTLRMRVRRKSGDYEWIQWHARVFERDDQGKVISQIGHVRIITPLVAAEQALQQSEERYRQLFQNSTVAVLTFNKQFIIQDANPACCQMLGHKLNSLRRMEITDITAPGARASLRRRLLSMKNGGCGPTVFDTVLERADGSRIEVQCSPTCITSDSNSQCMLVIHDMTGRNREEEDRRRAALLTGILLDNAPIAIALLDTDGRILRINRTAEAVFGIPASQSVGHELWSMPIFNAEDIDASKKRFLSVLTGSTDKVGSTLTLRAKDGSPRIIASETTAVRRAQGGTDFLVVTGMDMTERRRLEAEVIRAAQQEQLRIGHDLHDGVGQTLAGISAMVQTLADGLEGTHRQDAQRIHELVHGALEEVRRLSHGLSTAAVRRGGLAGGLRLLAESLRKDFRRQCDCQIDESLVFQNEEMQLHLLRIAQEAVNNAMRHGNAQKIHLSLRRQDANTLVLEITDNGQGMRKNAVVGEGAPPAGIGIQVMEYRANLIGGHLNVQEVSRKGVRVTCHFPDQFLKPELLTKPSSPGTKGYREK